MPKATFEGRGIGWGRLPAGAPAIKITGPFGVFDGNKVFQKNLKKGGVQQGCISFLWEKAFSSFTIFQRVFPLQGLISEKIL